MKPSPSLGQKKTQLTPKAIPVHDKNKKGSPLCQNDPKQASGASWVSSATEKNLCGIFPRRQPAILCYVSNVYNEFLLSYRKRLQLSRGK
ncbi:hypothetical protein ASG16_020720 [Brevibacillus sp. Leaf182]|nr:hypothetical protein ASG16_020720 [Brevibacillus sp. Leaf182]